MENQEKSLVKLHPEAKEISFKHKFIIQHAFKKSISGVLGIHYFSLMIVDSNQTLSIFSSCPSLEFNMIHHDFWLYDGIFELKNHEDGAFFFWDELYANNLKSTLISEKERKYGFNFGFFIMKKIGSIFVIYSFATKYSHDREVYKSSLDILNKIGDYFLSELEPIYKNYITPTELDLSQKKAVQKLRLIVDNTKKKEVI